MKRKKTTIIKKSLCFLQEDCLALLEQTYLLSLPLGVSSAICKELSQQDSQQLDCLAIQLDFLVNNSNNSNRGDCLGHCQQDGSRVGLLKRSRRKKMMKREEMSHWKTKAKGILRKARQITSIK